jgi:hypothetical protein
MDRSVARLDLFDFIEHVRQHAGYFDKEGATVMRTVALVSPRWDRIMQAFKREGPPLFLRLCHDDNKRFFFRFELPTDYPRIVRSNVEIPISYLEIGLPPGWWEYRDEDKLSKLLEKQLEQQRRLRDRFREQLATALRDFYTETAARRMAKWMAATLFSARTVRVEWDLFTEGHSFA